MNEWIGPKIVDNAIADAKIESFEDDNFFNALAVSEFLYSIRKELKK